MKKLSIFAVVVILALTITVPAFAYNGPAPYTNSSGELMIPIDWAAQANSAEVVRDAEGDIIVFAHKIVPALYDGLGFVITPARECQRITKFIPESDIAIIQGGTEVKMPAVAELREGILFVPVQFAILATFIA